MKLVIWVKESDLHINTGLEAVPVENPLSDYDEVILPFDNVVDAIDCLRIVVGQLSRESK